MAHLPTARRFPRRIRRPAIFSSANCGAVPVRPAGRRYGRLSFRGLGASARSPNKRELYDERGQSGVQDASEQRQHGQAVDPKPPATHSELPAQELDLPSLWQAVRDGLRDSVPETTYRLWLEPLKAAAAQGDTLYVSAPDGI